MLANILVVVALVLAFLDLVFWYAVVTYRQRRYHLLLVFAVILLGLGVILGARGWTLT